MRCKLVCMPPNVKRKVSEAAVSELNQINNTTLPFNLKLFKYNFSALHCRHTIHIPLLFPYESYCSWHENCLRALMTACVNDPGGWWDRVMEGREERDDG